MFHWPVLKILSLYNIIYTQLLGKRFPPTLWKIHLMMEVEGNELRETLEPEQNLKHHLIWNKRDIYGQKVYGRYVYKVSF